MTAGFARRGRGGSIPSLARRNTVRGGTVDIDHHLLPLAIRRRRIRRIPEVARNRGTKHTVEARESMTDITRGVLMAAAVSAIATRGDAVVGTTIGTEVGAGGHPTEGGAIVAEASAAGVVVRGGGTNTVVVGRPGPPPAGAGVGTLIDIREKLGGNVMTVSIDPIMIRAVPVISIVNKTLFPRKMTTQRRRWMDTVSLGHHFNRITTRNRLDSSSCGAII
mmetsp:Transcript_24813/g.47524  ORF Transcript_24813/g.47524 Transcript_24813/m.47524 type:complete len:221 (+) Transcript_24813:109-771(+)